MTLLHADGFSHYTLTLNGSADVLLKWTSGTAGLISVGAGRVGNGAYQLGNATGLIGQFVGSKGTLIEGFAARFTTVAACTLFRFMNGATVQTDLRTLSDGRIQITQNGTVLGTTASPAFQNGVFSHIQFKTVFATTAIGSIEVKVNDVVVLTVATVITATTVATADTIQFISTSGVVIYISDHWVCDTLGTKNNTYLGDVRAGLKLPATAGTYAQWTPSALTNVQCVDENPPNTTDYVSAGTVGLIDSYNYTALPSSAGTVLAVQAILAIDKDDAGARSVAAFIRHGTTDFAGTTQAVSATTPGWQMLSQIFETNPANSGADWTVADVNADQFGVKLTA